MGSVIILHPIGLQYVAEHFMTTPTRKILEIANHTQLIRAVKNAEPVRGFTHDFYKYPARFSPQFVREMIEAFTRPGDLIVDPFVGGGTTLIEARLMNRHSIGLDISSLASFVTNVKINPPSHTDLNKLLSWSYEKVPLLNCHENFEKRTYLNNSHVKNMSDNNTWRIKKVINQFIFLIEKSGFSRKNQNFLRCGLLKTGQWALDNKLNTPLITEFREKLAVNIYEMFVGASKYQNELLKLPGKTHAVCFNRPASDTHKVKLIRDFGSAPRLILTSPPYPGIHIVYHRWQINGKKETAAPFWIANSLDGHGIAHYTMGSRHQEGLTDYFDNVYNAFSSLRTVCDSHTTIVQMLAFSEPRWQLPKYLRAMENAGFSEVHLRKSRIWRDVPNRKWYAEQKGQTPSSKEVVFFHKVATN